MTDEEKKKAEDAKKKEEDDKKKAEDDKKKKEEDDKKKKEEEGKKKTEGKTDLTPEVSKLVEEAVALKLKEMEEKILKDNKDMVDTLTKIKDEAKTHEDKNKLLEKELIEMEFKTNDVKKEDIDYFEGMSLLQVKHEIKKYRSIVEKIKEGQAEEDPEKKSGKAGGEKPKFDEKGRVSDEHFKNLKKMADNPLELKDKRIPNDKFKWAITGK